MSGAARPDAAAPRPIPPAPPGEAAPTIPVHRDPNALRWLAAYVLSVLGTSVYFLSLGWAAQEVATPAQVGLVMAAGSLPRAALMLFGGVAADRFGPRIVIIGSDTARCVIILGVAAALALGSPGLWILIAVALVFGALDALFMPAVGALPPRLTGPSQLARLQSLRILAIRVGQTTGPPTAGFVLGMGGTAVAFALSGVLFAVSLALLLTLRIAPLPAAPAGHSAAEGDGAEGAERPAGEAAGKDAPPASAWQELVEGLRLALRHRLLGPLILAVTLTDLTLAGPLNVGVVLLAAERGWGASGAGWLIAGFGAGAAAGAVLVAVRGWLPRAGLLTAFLVALATGGIAVVGLAPSLPAAVAAAALAGIGGGTSGAIGFGLLQNATPPGMLGRVTSIATMGSLGIAPLVYPVTGAAIGVFGSSAVFTVSGVLGLSGAAVLLAAPAVRAAQLPRDRPEPAGGRQPDGTA